MRTLESGVTQPERGRREIGLQGKFSLGQPGDRSRQGANHGGHQLVQPKRIMVQRAAQPLTGDSVTNGESMRASRSKKENKTGLPDRLKAGIENLSGYSMDDVRVHYNSTKPAQLQALAYAQGTIIHVGPGQEKHLPHEAWHVVQQKQGRVKGNKQIKGYQINENSELEREATMMGEFAKNFLSQGKEKKYQSKEVVILEAQSGNHDRENPRNNSPIIRADTASSPSSIPPVQRKIDINGEKYSFTEIYDRYGIPILASKDGKNYRINRNQMNWALTELNSLQDIALDPMKEEDRNLLYHNPGGATIWLETIDTSGV
ncbi:MAG: DUF4157 domain-containing protein [Moorea sp. SIO2I5]|nr:DUF4157 domain-containing protein [Moorena sp. SIO2I5]